MRQERWKYHGEIKEGVTEFHSEDGAKLSFST